MEQQTAGKHLHIGMRIVKTVIAVFVCGLLAYIRDKSGFYSMIAAVVCVQNSTGKTIESSVNRVAGTLIGGVVGVLVVYVLDLMGILYIQLARYAILALVLIPIIEFCLIIKKPACAAMACIVFLCVTVDHSPESAPAIYAIQRVFETMVGVAVACVVDILLPHRTAPAEPAEAEPAPPSAQENVPAEPELLPVAADVSAKPEPKQAPPLEPEPEEAEP